FLFPTPTTGVGVVPTDAVKTLGDAMKSRSARSTLGIGANAHRSAPVSASSATSDSAKPVAPEPTQSPTSTYTAPLPASTGADDVTPPLNGGCHVASAVQSASDAQSCLCVCSPEVERHTRKGTQLAPEQSVSVVQGFVVSVPQTCSGSGSNRQTSAPVAASNAMTAPRTQGLSRCDDLPT